MDEAAMANKGKDRNKARIARALAFQKRAFSRQYIKGSKGANGPVAWGADYGPAIKADPKEAPRHSSPSAGYSARLGRTLHASSIAEAVFLALALYHPKVIEIHENHVLNPWPALHPLAAHPEYRFRPWPSTEGTLKIADSLGRLGGHPKVLVGEEHEVIPWIGDILVFLTDAQDHPRAIEWDVKSETGKHAKPWSGNWPESEDQRANDRAALREQVYQRYMAELCIPIKRVARDQVHPWVAANLMHLCARSSRTIGMPQAQIDEIGAALEECVLSGAIPAEVIKCMARKPQDVQPATEILYRWIWDRRIRVDLCKPILIDHPLNPELVDPLDTFNHLFN
jgi:hypothetical protein